MLYFPSVIFEFRKSISFKNVLLTLSGYVTLILPVFYVVGPVGYEFSFSGPIISLCQ